MSVLPASIRRVVDLETSPRKEVQTFFAYARDTHDVFSGARDVLLDAGASDETLCAACDVLAESDHWQDIRAVSNARNLLWAMPGSEIVHTDMPPLPVWDYAPAKPSPTFVPGRPVYMDDDRGGVIVWLIIGCAVTLLAIGIVIGISAALARQQGYL